MWAVLLERYSGLFLKQTRKELRQKNRKKRKSVMMHKALNPRYNLDKLYMSSKE